MDQSNIKYLSSVVFVKIIKNLELMQPLITSYFQSLNLYTLKITLKVLYLNLSNILLVMHLLLIFLNFIYSPYQSLKFPLIDSYLGNHMHFHALKAYSKVVVKYY